MTLRKYPTYIELYNLSDKVPCINFGEYAGVTRLNIYYRDL